MMRRSWGFAALGVSICLAASALHAEDAAKDGKTREVPVKDITLKVPETWKQTEPTGPAARLRLAQFEIPAAEGDSEPALLVISSFPGGGGGLEQNLSRWTGEFSSEGRDVKVTQGTSPQGEYIIADVTGTHVGPGFSKRAEPLENARLLAMMLTAKGEKGVYYLKVSGPERTIAGAATALRTAIGVDAKSEKKYDREAN